MQEQDEDASNSMLGGLDERYASERAVCMALHRTLLLSPILGMPHRLGRCVFLAITFLFQNKGLHGRAELTLFFTLQLSQ
jgi:hypothetical protein